MKKARLLIPALVALALACLVSLALTARAQAFIYWTDADTHSIGRSTLDGTGAQADFITGITRPGAMAVDNHYIYWADQETASIARAKLDGTVVDPDFITGIRYNTGYPVDNLRVTGVGVSPDYVYWATASARGAVSAACASDGSPPAATCAGATIRSLSRCPEPHRSAA